MATLISRTKWPVCGSTKYIQTAVIKTLSDIDVPVLLTKFNFPFSREPTAVQQQQQYIGATLKASLHSRLNGTEIFFSVTRRFLQ